MKKVIQIVVGISIIACLYYLNIEIGNAGNIIMTPYNVDVTTAGTLGRGILANRRYYFVVNASSWNVVYQTTCPATASNYTQFGCTPINFNFGWWEEEISINISSRYYCTATGTAKIHIIEKE